MRIRFLLNILLPLLILAVAGLIAARLIATRPLPERVVRETPAVLVETMTAARKDKIVIVRATGTAQAARESSVVPQVAGQIVQVSGNLVAGGFFRQGELMLAVENADYLLALERTNAEIVRAEMELAKVQGAALVAQEEWKRFGVGDGGERAPAPNALVLYEPQLKHAQAALRAAVAARDQARLNLERTRITAPYNCRVRSQSVAVGQFAYSGAPVAQIADTDSVEIFLPVRLDELDWLDVPGAKALIRVPDRPEATWTGRVVRSLGEIDPKTRMATLVVSVADPYGLGRTASTGQRPLDLPVGLFVEVDLEGVVLPGVAVIPRRALRENSTVWLADDAGTLRIQPVQVLRAQGDELFIGAGVEPGQQVILTSLTGVGQGMAVRTIAAGSRP